MDKAKSKGSGTRQSPWVLKTPPGTSDFEAYRDEAADPPALVVQGGRPGGDIRRPGSVTFTRRLRGLAAGLHLAAPTSRSRPAGGRGRGGAGCRRIRFGAFLGS